MEHDKVRLIIKGLMAQKVTNTLIDLFAKINGGYYRGTQVILETKESDQIFKEN